jgi:hypothetical protein
MSQQSNTYCQVQVKHEDKDLRDDTAFKMNNAIGSMYRVTYHMR